MSRWFEDQELEIFEWKKYNKLIKIALKMKEKTHNNIGDPIVRQ